LQLSGQVKAFIREQEEAGNKVLLPKINDKIIGVQIGKSNLIKIYSIRLKQFVRQFILTNKEVIYDTSTFGDDGKCTESIEDDIEYLLQDADIRLTEAEKVKLNKRKKKRATTKALPFMQPYKHSYRAKKQEFLDEIAKYLSENAISKSKKSSKKSKKDS